MEHAAPLPFWQFAPFPSHTVVGHLQACLQVPEPVAVLLAQRGIDSFESARQFFRPALSDLSDPFCMKGMTAAVSRLQIARHHQEKVLFYGDYDVDGTTSAAMCMRFFSAWIPSIYYVPDRYSEGYGLSEKGIRHAAKEECSLVVCLDCGITATEQVRLAHQLGIEVIICDHHQPGPELPEALAILNPLQPDCPYPYKYLSGCGIGFRLVQAFCQAEGLAVPEATLLQLAALSIACDLVPLTGENRILAWHGMKHLAAEPLPGLKHLLQIGQRKGTDVHDLVFGIGPMLNAAGRMAHASLAVKTLLTTQPEEAARYASLLQELNEQRRGFEQKAMDDITAMTEQATELPPALVLHHPGWHKGVVGILAAKAVERFHRPVVVLTTEKDALTGSARTPQGLDLYGCLLRCAHLLEKFGGHRHAAGLTLAPENLAAFSTCLAEAVREEVGKTAGATPGQASVEVGLPPALLIDLSLRAEQLEPRLFRIVEQMAPFGPGNMRPVMALHGLRVAGHPRLMKEQHLRFAVQLGTGRQNVIGFRMAGHLPVLQSNAPFDLAFVFKPDTWQGGGTFELEARGLRPSPLTQPGGAAAAHTPAS